MPVRILTEPQLRSSVDLNEAALLAVEEAFTWTSTGRAEMPPIMHIEVTGGGGDVDIKSAYVRGLESFAVKIASGFPGNVRLGLPSGNGLMVVLSAETGACQAVLLDNGYLTDLRTALAGAVAAKHLAPRAVETAGVVGTGVQARFQVRALQLVREFRRLLIYGRDPDKASACRSELSEQLAVEVEVAPSVEALVRQSQCVVTTTSSRAALVDAAWLHPGLHLTAMGSDLPGKQELDAGVLRRADLVACDSLGQVRRLGELQHLGPDELPEAFELGEVTAGQRPGRTDDGAVTVCDLTGMGTQDTAIARLALERALAAGAGTNVEGRGPRRSPTGRASP